MTTAALLKTITIEQALEETKGKGPTIAELEASYGQIVAEVEAEFPPDFPILPKRGRPKADSRVMTAKIKSVRMEPEFWDDLSMIANSQGLTIHAAMKIALIEYSERKHAEKRN